MFFITIDWHKHTKEKQKQLCGKKKSKTQKELAIKFHSVKVNGKLFLVKTLNLKFLQSKKMKFRFPWFRTIWYAILRSWLRQKSHQGNWLVLPCIQDEVESIWYHEIPSFAPGLLKIHDETDFHSWDIFHHWLIDQLLVVSDAFLKLLALSIALVYSSWKICDSNLIIFY